MKKIREVVLTEKERMRIMRRLNRQYFTMYDERSRFAIGLFVVVVLIIFLMVMCGVRA